jgi:ABC-type branched-subunit amino acid transport system ATPase component
VVKHRRREPQRVGDDNFLTLYSASVGVARLEIRDLEFSYGPLQVLFDVGMSVGQGERVALLGTNGAGKSTLLKVVSGLEAPTAGQVLFDGEDITATSPEERVRRGIVQMAGGRATFPSLSVAENLRIGGYPFRRDAARLDDAVERALVLFPELKGRLRQAAGTLSGGEQQMMAMARALIARPTMLLIDELSLGLAPIVIAKILEVVEQLADEGMTMLLVEQSLNVALALAERAYFMEKGEIRFEGRTADLLERDDIARSVFFGAAR